MTLRRDCFPSARRLTSSWTGGWDEIPNDAAGVFQNRDLVDHGELWSPAWDVVETSASIARLQRICQTVPVTVEKTIALDETQPTATITYRFQNHADETISFLFKQHMAIEPVDLGFSKIIGRAQKTRFPHALAADSSEITVQQIPPASSQLQEFYYSSDLAIGECGIRSHQSKLLLSFDRADFPYVWVFQSYGGWGTRYVLVLEPCTTIPYDLSIATQNGTIAQLQPHETQTCTLTVRLQ